MAIAPSQDLVGHLSGLKAIDASMPEGGGGKQPSTRRTS